MKWYVLLIGALLVSFCVQDIDCQGKKPYQFFSEIKLCVYCDVIDQLKFEILVTCFCVWNILFKDINTNYKTQWYAEQSIIQENKSLFKYTYNLEGVQNLGFVYLSSSSHFFYSA